MESQPQNPEFRDNPENFHPCIGSYVVCDRCITWLYSLAFCSTNKKKQ